MGHMLDNGDDVHTWPSALLDAQRVRAWIASAFPGDPTVEGPVQVYQAKEWGVTARFMVTWPRPRKPGRGQREPARPLGHFSAPRPLMAETRPTQPDSVVFKASLLPLFAHAPYVYSLLTRHCSGAAPELLAWTPRHSGAWMLFAPFAGVSVSVLPGLDPLLAMARALAAIQSAIASLPGSETTPIPRVCACDFPAMFDAVLEDIRARSLAFWRGDGRELAEQFDLPDAVDERLARFRPRVTRWAAEMEAGDWPLSLDHVDLQPDNAVLQPNGRILLYDWEEANLSLPFFSLDRLLDDARERAGDEGEAALRAAYLNALPWRTTSERERALTLALCLSPLKHAYEGMRFAEALGWEEGLPHVTAWAVARMLARWESGR